LVVVLLSILFAWLQGTARAQSNRDEYQVKAAFLFHFAQLVDWPADKLTVTAIRFLYALLGKIRFKERWKVL
jgi:hypothetical protein